MTTKMVPHKRAVRPRRRRMEAIAVETAAVTCGFCEGRGRDPFGIMSHLSTCCVCGGGGAVSIRKPYVRCAFCQGSGVHPYSRLTCTACDGVGASAVAEPHQPCPHCQGTGAEPGSAVVPLWCFACHGAGMATAMGS